MDKGNIARLDELTNLIHVGAATADDYNEWASLAGAYLSDGNRNASSAFRICDEDLLEALLNYNHSSNDMED